MSYQDALNDLKEAFGKQKLLTPADIAPYIGKSPSAQASMRTRKQFPIAKKDMGGRIVISIYDLARFIGGEDDELGISLEPAVAEKSHKATKTSARGMDKSKPYRRPPSLGKTLLTWQARIGDLTLQLQFHQELFAELEAVAIDQTLKKPR
jgi:hypothetical protein